MLPENINAGMGLYNIYNGIRLVRSNVPPALIFTG
jgi:hypothetical protein